MTSPAKVDSWSQGGGALLLEAQKGAKKLGHAVVIVRRGQRFFIADSWQKVEGKVVATVSTSGVVVRA